MIKYIQLDTGDTTGSCWATCIASLLEVPLDTVPNFILDKKLDMDVATDRWLREKYNKRLITFQLYGPKKMPIKPQLHNIFYNPLAYSNPDDLVILSGKSPRKTKDGKTKYHAVIGRAKPWGFELAHDPHPSGKGIVGQPYGLSWIVNL